MHWDSTAQSPLAAQRRDSNIGPTQSGSCRNGGTVCKSSGVELHPDKTRLIEFGRHATEHRKQRGDGKPEVFDFLGFTHICGKPRKTGSFIVHRKTIRKRLSAKLAELKRELRRRWHEPIAATGKWLKSVIRGYFNYHAYPGTWIVSIASAPKSFGVNRVVLLASNP